MSFAASTVSAQQEIDPIVLSSNGQQYVCFLPEQAKRVLEDVKLAHWYENTREPELIAQRDSFEQQANENLEARRDAESSLRTAQDRKATWRLVALTEATLILLAVTLGVVFS